MEYSPGNVFHRSGRLAARPPRPRLAGLDLSTSITLTDVNHSSIVLDIRLPPARCAISHITNNRCRGPGCGVVLLAIESSSLKWQDVLMEQLSTSFNDTCVKDQTEILFLHIY